MYICMQCVCGFQDIHTHMSEIFAFAIFRFPNLQVNQQATRVFGSQLVGQMPVQNEWEKQKSMKNDTNTMPSNAREQR